MYPARVLWSTGLVQRGLATCCRGCTHPGRLNLCCWGRETTVDAAPVARRKPAGGVSDSGRKQNLWVYDVRRETWTRLTSDAVPVSGSQLDTGRRVSRIPVRKDVGLDAVGRQRE